MFATMSNLTRMAIRLLALLCVLQITATAPAVQAGDTAAEERLVKVAYIYNFAKFTRWPAHTGVEANVPLKFCTVGDDPVVQALGQVSGRRVKGNLITVQGPPDQAVTGSCHLLYIAGSEQHRRGEILQSVRNMPILTVSEIPGFARTGGMIELFREQDRIRFIINLKAARDTGLEISPNLLALAVVIGRDNAP